MRILHNSHQRFLFGLQKITNEGTCMHPVHRKMLSFIQCGNKGVKAKI